MDYLSKLCTPPLLPVEYKQFVEGVAKIVGTQVTYTVDPDTPSVICRHRNPAVEGEPIRVTLPATDGRAVLIGGSGPTQLLLAIETADEKFILVEHDKCYKAGVLFNLSVLAKAPIDDYVRVMEKKWYQTLLQNAPPPKKPRETSKEALKAHCGAAGHNEIKCLVCALADTVEDAENREERDVAIYAAVLARQAIPSKRQDYLEGIRVLQVNVQRCLLMSAHLAHAIEQTGTPEEIAIASDLVDALIIAAGADLRAAILCCNYVKVPTTSLLESYLKKGLREYLKQLLSKSKELADQAGDEKYNLSVIRSAVNETL